jgi:hypothetical protein
MANILDCIGSDRTFLPALQHVATELADAGAPSLAQETMELIKADDMASRHPLLDQFVHARIRVELVRIALATAGSVHIQEPSRDEKRTRKGMIGWFERNWSDIELFLPSISRLEGLDPDDADDAKFTEGNWDDDS